MGKMRAASRSKRGYWTAQANRTRVNKKRKLERHCALHPNDGLAAAVLKTR